MATIATTEPLSRRGYLLKDLVRNFNQSLGETGTDATGRLLHYTADLIGSGGYELWTRLCWDYAYDHIGIASPRIFVYLKQKFTELGEKIAKLPLVTAINSPEIQRSTAEVVLILQTCPKRAKVRLPTVPVDTHQNDTWLSGTARSTPRSAVVKVWSQSTDLPILYTATNEMVGGITEGALERALFWLRWVFEEDAGLRKKYGSGLSTRERGPAFLSPKQRTHPGFFICAVLAEVYKEFAERGLMRMHEEFQTLLDIYRSVDKGVGARRKQDSLILMVQILVEVPRWKVSAAPSLIKDPLVLSRAVGMAEIFYKEIMLMPALAKPLPNKISVGCTTKKKGIVKQDEVEEHLDLVDRAIMSFYGVM